MNTPIFAKIRQCLSDERLTSYGSDEQLVLARYAWNTSLCESLYTGLQFAEISLRNKIHAALTVRAGGPAWFDNSQLSPWQVQKLQEARQSLLNSRKPLTPGRIVAELNFGFWTGFFNRHHTHTGLAAWILKHCFPSAPNGERTIRKMDQLWRRIRDLRNRVFHHERIIHWADLTSQHAAILQVIFWMEPALETYLRTIDRFATTHTQGTAPWLAEPSNHTKGKNEGT